MGPSPLARIWDKNREDIRAIVSGSLPRFARRAQAVELGREIPIFCFHSVESDRLERQLRYLADNGYRTVAADELVDLVQDPPSPGHRTVALTFDDATGSFWATAFPLLRKYGFKSILYVVSGLVPDDETYRPNLDDVWSSRATMDQVARREETEPLCSWRELTEMHRSGLVDLQSHSLTHSRIPISGRVIDFLHPAFDPSQFANVNVPVARDDVPDRPARRMVLGAPIYEYASRFEARPRYLGDARIHRVLVDHVEARGGADYFNRPGWRRELVALHGSAETRSDAFESRQEMLRWIEVELSRSKAVLEERVPAAAIRHFCYPWFRGSADADRVAARCGYRSVSYGLQLPPPEPVGDGPVPVRLRRISEEYLFCLPGRGRKKPLGVWLAKVRRFAGGRR